jgi:hypothetical protein
MHFALIYNSTDECILFRLTITSNCRLLFWLLNGWQELRVFMKEEIGITEEENDSGKHLT